MSFFSNYNSINISKKTRKKNREKLDLIAQQHKTTINKSYNSSEYYFNKQNKNLDEASNTKEFNNYQSSKSNMISSIDTVVDNLNYRYDKKISHRKKYIKNTILSIIVFLFLLIITIASFIFMSLSKLSTINIPTLKDDYLYNTNGASNTNNIYINSDYPLAFKEQYDKDVKNILLFGSDTIDPNEVGRSDAIIIITLNYKDNDIRLSSILRDSEVYVPDYGNIKINATYSYGGVTMLMNAINDNFDLDIHDFIKVDLWSSVYLVDALGGIDIDIKDENELFYTNDILRQMRDLHPDKEILDIKKVGMNRLTGAQAVAYSRNRNSDSDFGRTNRQRIVLEAMMSKLKSFNIYRQMNFFNTLCSQLVTNLSKEDLLALSFKSLPLLKHSIKTYHVPEDNLFYNDTSTYNLVIDFEQQIPALHSFIWN